MTVKSIPLALIAVEAHALDAARFMDELAWEKRVLVIFASDASDAALRQQDQALAIERDGLAERQITVIRVFANGLVSVDGQNQDNSAASFYQHFGTAQGRFRVFLVGKDGSVKLDRAVPVSVADLFSLTDSMPMRRQEMRDDG